MCVLIDVFTVVMESGCHGNHETLMLTEDEASTCDVRLHCWIVARRVRALKHDLK